MGEILPFPSFACTEDERHSGSRQFHCGRKKRISGAFIKVYNSCMQQITADHSFVGPNCTPAWHASNESSLHTKSIRHSIPPRPIPLVHSPAVQTEAGARVCPLYVGPSIYMYVTLLCKNAQNGITYPKRSVTTENRS